MRKVSISGVIPMKAVKNTSFTCCSRRFVLFLFLHIANLKPGYVNLIWGFIFFRVTIAPQWHRNSLVSVFFQATSSQLFPNHKYRLSDLNQSPICCFPCWGLKPLHVWRNFEFGLNEIQHEEILVLYTCSSGFSRVIPTLRMLSLWNVWWCPCTAKSWSWKVWYPVQIFFITR